MLRVIAGTYKSRKIKDVKSNQTRPTTDKNKETIFNSIGQFFNGGKVLDLYAGSGSLGIEALSRGMETCDFVDKQFAAIKVIRENIKTLNIHQQAHVHKMDAFSFLNKVEDPYDLILIDPPYKLKPYDSLIKLIHDRQLIVQHGIIVMESDHETMINGYKDLVKVKEKKLGQSKISIFRRESL
jgi:16S rRNA (guanine(966)-N(2))-methyltransferase RsmD